MAKNKLQVFVNDQNEIVATGRIAPSYIDLLLADGTRYYSTFSIDALKDLDIKGVK